MSDDASWTLRVAAPAARKIAEVLPEAVAAAVVEFITGALPDSRGQRWHP